MKIPENLLYSELKDLVEKLAIDPNYGCWTRPGLEYIAWPEIRERALFTIFADLDHLHQLNDIHGHETMNLRIREAMQIRKTDEAAAGRWYSGDELVWFLCEDPERPEEIDPVKAAERLQDAFRQFGISATFGIARVLSYDLAENVLPAYQTAQRAKRHGRRGTINQTRSLHRRA